jgi:hypothetical protein
MWASVDTCETSSSNLGSGPARGMPNYLLEVHDEEFLRRSQLHIALDALGRWAATQPSHHPLHILPVVHRESFVSLLKR